MWTRQLILMAWMASGCAARRWAAEPVDVSLALDARVGSGLRPEASDGALPEGVDLGDGLSPDEAVAIALWNNPDLDVALTSLGLSRADLVASGMLANPTVSGLIPLSPRQWQFAVTMPLDGLWLRPLRVAAARAANEAAMNRVLQVALDLVADVKLAVLQASAASARRERRAALEAIEAGRQERVRLLVEVGDVAPQLGDDALRRRLDASRLARTSVRDEVGADVDLARLTGLRGIEDLPMVPLEVLVPEAPVPSAEALTQLALADRPEVAAARSALDAANASVHLARASIVPAALGLHVQGGGSSTNNGAGLTPSLTVPLFNWNQDGLARANAEVAMAEARYRALTQRLGFDIAQAVAELHDAVDALALLADEVAPTQRARVDRAEVSVAAGDVSPVELLVAQADAIAGDLALIDARARVGAAWIALERAVGAVILPVVEES